MDRTAVWISEREHAYVVHIEISLCSMCQDKLCKYHISLDLCVVSYITCRSIYETQMMYKKIEEIKLRSQWLP